MFAEVDAANVRRSIVDHDELLVIAAKQTPRRKAVGIRELNLHSSGAQFLDHQFGRARFLAQLHVEQICRRIPEAVVQDDARKRIGENLLFTRWRGPERG